MALNLGGWGGGDSGATLGGMSQGGGVLASLGIDPEEAQMNPEVRARLAAALKSPYGAAADSKPVEVAQARQPVNDASGSIPERVTEPVLKKRPAAAPAQAPQGAPPASLTENPGSLTPVASGGQAGVPAGQGTGSSAWQQDAARRSVGNVLDTAGKIENAYGDSPNAPNTAEIDKTIEKYSQPKQLYDTDPNSPTYGKMFKDYKPGFWGELKRGVANFAAGFGGHPEQATAYSAPNSRYQNLETDRTQRLLPAAEKSKADLLADFAAKVKAREDWSKGLTPVMADVNNAGKNAVDAQRAESESPEGKDRLKALEEKRRAEAMSDPVLSKPVNAYQRSRYIATGEMQPAHEHEPSFEEQEYGRQAAQWRMQHRGETMPEEVEQQIYQRVHGRAGEAAVEGPNGEAPFTVQQAAAKGLDAVSAYTNLWTRTADGMNYRSESGNSIPYNEYQAKVKELLSKANKDIARSGWEINDQGQLVKHDAAAQPAGGAAAAAQPVAGGPTPVKEPTRPKGVPSNAQYITNPATGKKGWAW